jgi:hypothetical protein
MALILNPNGKKIAVLSGSLCNGLKKKTQKFIFKRFKVTIFPKKTSHRLWAGHF